MKSTHGGDIYSEEVVLDFSANLNPLGAPLSVKQAAAAADLEHYPDPYCRALRAAVSAYENIPASRIVCGNGAADLIYRITSALRPRRALLCSPTFSEYEKALLECGCEVAFHPLLEKDNFTLGWNILPKITPDIGLIFLCSPNNPVGNVISPVLLGEIIERCRSTGAFIVVDECFWDFMDFSDLGDYSNSGDLGNSDTFKDLAGGFSAKRYLNPSYNSPNGRVIVLKAFTKICAMAGIRLGYALFSDEETAAAVSECGQAWSVSSPAQAAGAAAAEVLLNTDYLARTRSLIAKEREFLTKNLERLGVRVFPSRANFLLLKSGVNLAEILAREKIAIRRCADYRGLGCGFYRIAVRSHEENLRLLAALEQGIAQRK